MKETAAKDADLLEWCRTEVARQERERAERERAEREQQQQGEPMDKEFDDDIDGRVADSLAMPEA